MVGKVGKPDHIAIMHISEDLGNMYVQIEVQSQRFLQQNQQCEINSSRVHQLRLLCKDVTFHRNKVRSILPKLMELVRRSLTSDINPLHCRPSPTSPPSQQSLAVRHDVRPSCLALQPSHSSPRDHC